MSLDVRTIMLVFSALTLMFSGLLALVGRYTGNVKGVGHWALANLLMASGFAFSYSFSTTLPNQLLWPIVAASVLIVSGLCLQYAGIQRFKEKPINWKFVALAVAAIFVSGIWFTGIHNNVTNRAIVNSIVFGIVFIACARELLIPTEAPLRIAYWLTGISFGALSVLVFARAAILWQSSTESYGLFQNIPINPLTFLGICLLQFSTMFGFVLMLAYRLVGELAKLASQDPLTGAFNRRRLEEEALRVQARSIRTGKPMAVMMIDVDHFKTVNDRFGHQVGDEVLKHVAKIIETTIRADDYFGRYGGEEFCILLPSTAKDEAYAMGERLRQIYADTSYLFDGQHIHSTISIGIADSADVGTEFKTLVQAADKALYEAKQAGRNLVMQHASVAMFA